MFYKLVRIHNGICRSAIIIEGDYLGIIYTPNEWVTPKIGKVFVFDSFAATTRFVRHNYDYEPFQIWGCDVVNPIKFPVCATNIDDRNKFWEVLPDMYLKHMYLKPYPVALSKSPRDTYVADSIRLTTLVHSSP